MGPRSRNSWGPVGSPKQSGPHKAGERGEGQGHVGDLFLGFPEGTVTLAVELQINE